MTRQIKNLGRIGPVKFRSDRNLLTPTAESMYLVRDKLNEFLKVDATKNSNAVVNFCRRYAYMPEDVSEGWQNAFVVEQILVKSFLDKITSDSVTQDDLDLLTERRKSSYIKYQLVDKEKLQQLQSELKSLNGKPKVNEHLDGQKYLIEVICETSSFSSLWRELETMLKSRRKLAKCKNCKEYFFKNKYQPKQIFCSKECSDKY